MDSTKRVIALGFFDGIHIGHAALIEKAKTMAKRMGAKPTVLTFDVHPDNLIFGRPVPLLNSPEDRRGLLRRVFGIEDVIFIHFDEEIMHMSWDVFIERLTADFNVAGLVAGHDFHFGYRGQGNPERLQEKCAQLGIACAIIHRIDLDGITISSTYIRGLISQGEIERANAFLGHPHVLTDVVRHGHKFGTSMGVPTINMRFPEGVIIPPYGVYATKVLLEGERVPRSAVTNIGVRPTLSDSREVSAESYIIDFSGDIYGSEVRVEFYKMLRRERKFGSVEELKTQIQKDIAETKALFGN